MSQALASIPRPYTAQQDESDLNLLVRLGKKYDAFVKPASGQLVLAKRGETKSVSGQQLTAITVTPASDVTSFHVMETARDSSGDYEEEPGSRCKKPARGGSQGEKAELN